MKNHTPYYLNLKGQLTDISRPCVMGILNATPDSFYAESRQQTEAEIINRTHQIIDEGGTFIDLGAYSSRPNARHISATEEMERLRFALSIIVRETPDTPISIDTFRADVARMCVQEYGAALINDISGGDMDDNMFQTIVQLGVPYILMHMKGTPQSMQQDPHYDNVVKEVMLSLAQKVDQLRQLGAKDLILDPGFGFGKTLVHNYELLNKLEEFQLFGLPLLVGVSRKSMIYRLLSTDPDGALNGTTAIHAIALLKGANILRVHDVKEAVQAVRIFETMCNPYSSNY